MHITLIAAFNHNFIAFISHLVTLLWPLSVVASYPPVITIVFPLLSGIPQAPAPLCSKANELPPERGIHVVAVSQIQNLAESRH